MIIYGSRMYGVKNVVKSVGFCEHCGDYTTFKSYTGRRWGHLYFIPLIPESGHVHVLKECKTCDKGNHIPIDSVSTIIEACRKDIGEAVGALAKNKYVYSGKDERGNFIEIPCIDSIIASVDMLYNFGEKEDVGVLLCELQEKKMLYVFYIMNGIVLELEGKLDRALEEFKKAFENNPDNNISAYRLMGNTLFLMGKLHDALEYYEKMLKMTDDKLDIYLNLLNVFGGLKNHLALAETFEKCFEESKELAKDKKFVKQYKKACKKAGRKPDITLIS